VVSVKSHTPLSAGYSGTPLAKKLGIAAGSRVCALFPPLAYRELVAPWPPGAELADRADARTDLVHLFAGEREVLARELPRLRRLLRDDAVLWVSWPKKAAKLPTDLSEDVVREIALPLGLVDIKVCAVDATWSALKLVVRRELRGAAHR
jgi:hypothetical protein